VDVTREQHFWLAQGSGRNGKTVLFETTGEAMGDYAGSGKTEMILDHNAVSGASLAVDGSL